MPSAKKSFILLCLAHLTFWTLAPALFQKNGALDVVEAIAWGGQWQLGYDRDPFLVAWLAHIASLFGGSSLWSIYLLSQACIITCFWSVWRLARDMHFKSTHALMAVLFLEGIFYYHFSTPEFNDNVLQIPLWSLTALFYYRALVNQEMKDWLLTGTFIALAMLAKYFSVMLMVPMALLLVLTPQGRASFKNIGIHVAGVLSLIILSPSLYWQYQHGFSYIHYALNRAAVAPSLINHFIYPIKFIFAQLLALSPALVLFLLTTKTRFNLKKQADFNTLFLIVMALGPLLTTVMYCAITGTQMRSMWGTPLFSLLGLLLVHLSLPQEQTLKKYVFATASFFFISLVSYLSLVTISPYFLGYAKNEFYPSQQIANDVTKLWRNKTHQPLTYVAGPRRLSARVSVYSSDHPHPYFDWNSDASPWISQSKLNQKGAIFLWDVDKYGANLPDEIAERYPRAVTHIPRIYRWQTGAPNLSRVTIGIAILPPIG